MRLGGGRAYVPYLPSQTLQIDKNTPDLRKSIKIRHPFHPENGKEYEYIGRIQTKYDDRVKYLDKNGKMRIIPTRMTDLYEESIISSLSGGNCALSFDDLTSLKTLVDTISNQTKA